MTETLICSCGAAIEPVIDSPPSAGKFYQRVGTCEVCTDNHWHEPVSEQSKPIPERWKLTYYSWISELSDEEHEEVRLIEQLGQAEQERDQAIAAHELQKGANRAQDDRERVAAKRLEMVHNCDWPDEVADLVLGLRDEVAKARKDALEEAIRAVCSRCRSDVPLVERNGSMYHEYHAGFDYRDCFAHNIRAIAAKDTQEGE